MHYRPGLRATILPSTARLHPASLAGFFSPTTGLLLLLLALAYFPLYYDLGRHPIQLWDESRQAVNAVEMLRSGDWLITRFEGQPDLWNTKPPLLIWLQALSLYFFGFSELAVRLPTALATGGTILIVYFFAARTLRRPLVGFLAGLVLITSLGYVRLHVARTGDYDALLTFFQTLLWSSLYRYLVTGRKREAALLTVAVTGAILTKGVAGVLGLPALFLYVLYRRRIGWLLRQPSFYLAAGSTVFLVAGYYGIREWAAPGYWAAVQQNELGGRFDTVLSGHQHPWDYYILAMQELRFAPWHWVLLPTLVLAWRQPRRPLQHAVVLLALFSIVWLLVISNAQTKLEWYDAPVYPALSLLVGLGLWWLGRAVVSTYFAATYNQLLGALGLIIFVFYAPYQRVLEQIREDRYSDYGLGPNARIGSYLRQLHHDQPLADSLQVLYPGGYDARLTYYQLTSPQRFQKNITIISPGAQKSLRPRQVVVVCDPNEALRLDSLYQTVPLHSAENCNTLLILRPR
ncbi:glycosyltransferase family 39 protein [Hymenobacter sp. BT188]|uniref:ArnT family glycosyltransferase n=1 Tax=Hymenobacter sp. BT188 TaxID=2763504 RepID=UPI001650D8EF|nr:glycosyltransferase family 39 protein [Hymenobacter sp. BT188]MBC6608394.1 glycosyltransferase family 39 protein [Hymenobacter sp. BT188]